MAPFAQKTLPAHMRPEVRKGRPSEYRPEYCDAVIAFMSQGYSLTAFAGSVRVSRETVYAWIREHAAFSDAVSRARSGRVAALEAKLMRSRKGAETTAAIFALRNADPTEWRDVKHTTRDVNVNVATLSDAQLNAIAAGRADAAGDYIDADYSVIDTP